VNSRAVAEWQRRVAAEYGSAALSAQVLTWSIQVGLGPKLLETAIRVVCDELDHARISHEVVVALGGDPAPVAVPAAPPQLAADGVLAALVEAVVTSFCLGESMAVPLFARMRARCAHPVVRPALDRILEDEAVHRAFGWSALDALLALDPAVGPFVEARLPAWVGRYGGYFDPPPAPPLDEEGRGLGLLDHEEYAQIARLAWEEDLRHRFGARGIQAPALAPRAAAS